MKNKELVFTPKKLQALQEELEHMIEFRKKARELVLPKEKINFIGKMKNIFNTY